MAQMNEPRTTDSKTIARIISSLPDRQVEFWLDGTEFHIVMPATVEDLTSVLISKQADRAAASNELNHVEGERADILAELGYLEDA